MLAPPRACLALVPLVSAAAPETHGGTSSVRDPGVGRDPGRGEGRWGPGDARLRGRGVLLFAGIGLTFSVGGERIIDEGIFAAVVIMVIVTTMLTPPALKWSLTRGERRARTGRGSR